MAKDALSELVTLLARWPGIGERTATRLAYHVLTSEPGEAHALAQAFATLHARIRRCERCANFDEAPLCRICSDTRREGALLCVVARVQELNAIEKTGGYRGRYHVLHGLVSPLDGTSAESLGLDAIADRVTREGVTEVIVATPLSVEGEATALYVREVVKALGVKVTRIASGVPHGGELEYTDRVTLGRAFDGRTPLD